MSEAYPDARPVRLEPVPPIRGIKKGRHGYLYGMDNEMSNGAQVTRYLDLDGDGVPDAVEMIEVVAVDRTGDGSTDEVAVVEELIRHRHRGCPTSLTVVDEMTLALEIERGTRSRQPVKRGASSIATRDAAGDGQPSVARSR